MSNSVQRTQELGQSIWYDNMRRGLLASGELQQLIDLGITGLTSNPTIFEKAVSSGSDYDKALLALAKRGASLRDSYEALVIEDIRAAADLLLPAYHATEGRDGYASLEVSPGLANDTEGTIAEAHRLFAALDRPNVMIKVPGTPAGIPAVRRLIGQGTNINVTLIFSLEAYAEVREAYVGGLEDLLRARGDVSRVASVASFFVSRVDTAVDAALEQTIAALAEEAEGRRELRGLLGKAAIANARLAYGAFRDTFNGSRFASLRAAGARPQRPLWASTGTKNPAYSDVLYIDSLIARDTVNTMPPPTLSAFLEHGRAEPILERVAAVDPRGVLNGIEAAGVSMKAVTDKLLLDGVKAFADSFDALLANIDRKKMALLRKPRVVGQASWPTVDAAVRQLEDTHAIERMWRGDHTLWDPAPKEITDRLGWLRMPEEMAHEAPALEAFGWEVKIAGFRHVVLLGMGGSSLGPEVLRQTFGSAPGYPELIVLDSTVPSAIDAVSSAVEPRTTLFIVSSKSGATIEPLSLYRFFRQRVVAAVGEKAAGKHFVAITENGTVLERLGRDRGFRHVFLNQPDIGGRYSVLSYFGLVPAAIIGMDLGKLLGRAKSAQAECGAAVAVAGNSGAWLGAWMAGHAAEGRDKLTLITSKEISSFGLWAEQLVAESTGKSGKGIIPVAGGPTCGEPLLAPEHYGRDRQFVYLRRAGANNDFADTAVAALAAAGQPVVEIGLADGYDLGGEFFRWEIAVAAAGALLGIHPFDQPDVQQSKDLTNELLLDRAPSNGVPPPHDLPEALLSGVSPGEYLAVLAYVHQTPEMDSALSDLRAAVMARWHIATTVGYGPRYLHSAGQLHKGGPAKGRFLFLTAEEGLELPVPGEGYSFKMLAQAQAVGDLQTLRECGRPVAHVHLTGHDASPDKRPAAVRKLAASISGLPARV